jgi:tRNA (mo5U34)-methyltransferase
VALSFDLDAIRSERAKWFKWKNTKEVFEKIKNLPSINDVKITLDDWIKVGDKSNLSYEELSQIYEVAIMLKPWRKGPFNLFGCEVDSEWQSYIKYNLIKKYFDIKDKCVADVGCNNGYYMFRMLEENPKRIVGFDPSAICNLHFDFINHFIKSDIVYELLGVEHIEYYERKFDYIFMLGVLYHRSDPISTLKSLNRALNSGGEILIDTFMIGDMDTTDEVALTPKDRYSKLPNIYFLPTIPALKNWLHRAKFVDIEVLEITKTDDKEQRKTPWINAQSLDDFTDDSGDLTVEGYPAPKRVYVKAKKK